MIFRGTFLRLGSIGALISGIVLGSGGAQASAPRWDLNDVSYLFALPESSQELGELLLAPESQGALGELLPWSDFRRIPTLLNHASGNETLYRTSLRVVGVRVDPCPIEAACVPEVRLVWQPVERDPETGAWTSQDGTLHTFYVLTPDQLTRLRRDLWELKAMASTRGIVTDGRPLGVHPAFQSPSFANAFGGRLKEILLRSCGARNLQKMTFMRLLTPAVWWRFGGFERLASGGGDWQAVGIPRLTTNFEDFFNSAFEEGGMDVPGKAMDAVINVLPETYPDADNLHSLVNRGYRYEDDRDENVFREKLDAIARFRNPEITSPRSLDCVSCHVADGAAYYASLRFPALARYRSAQEFLNPEPARFDLANTSPSARSTRIFRAFGYFKGQPAFLQRVINDSAVSAHWLNRTFPPGP